MVKVVETLIYTIHIQFIIGENMSEESKKYFEQIKLKDFIHNKDINRHIIDESLRMINQFEDKVKILNDILDKRNEELRKLEEEKFIIEITKDTEIEKLNYIITEQNKLIINLSKI